MINNKTIQVFSIYNNINQIKIKMYNNITIQAEPVHFIAC